MRHGVASDCPAPDGLGRPMAKLNTPGPDDRSTAAPTSLRCGIRESAAGLVGQGEVGGPADREATTLGPEHDEFEAPRAARLIAQVAGVVPPLRQPPVGPVVGGKHDRHGITCHSGTGFGCDRRHGTLSRRVGQQRTAGAAAQRRDEGRQRRPGSCRRGAPARVRRFRGRFRRDSGGGLATARGRPGRSSHRSLGGCQPTTLHGGLDLSLRWPAAGWPRIVRGAPGSTSSSGPGAASWPARAAPSRRSRRGRRRSPCQFRAP